MSKENTSSSDVSVMVPKEISNTLERAFNVGIDLYFKKGGIADTRKELDRLSTGPGSLGDEMLKAGRLCLSSSGNSFRHASALFIGACAQAEEKAKGIARDKGETNPRINDILPNWQANKSAIKSALAKEVNLSDIEKYPNITSVRAAVRPSRAPGGQTNQQGQQGHEIKVSQRLAAVLKLLHDKLATLNEAAQDEAANLLMPAVTQVQALGSAAEAAPASGTEAAPAQAAPTTEATPAAEASPATKAAKREAQKRGGRRAA